MVMTGGHCCLWTMVCLLHDLFCVTGPLHSNQGGEGSVTWGCEGTIAQGCILYNRGGGLHVGQLFPWISLSTNSLHAPLAPFPVLRMQLFKRDCTAVLVRGPSLHQGYQRPTITCGLWYDS